MSLIWAGWRAKAASSNSFCMSPRPKKPLPSRQLCVWTRSVTRLQISALPRAAAVRLCGCELRQSSVTVLDSLLVFPNPFLGLVLGPRDLRFPPTGRAAAVGVLDEQMGGADLAAAAETRVRGQHARAVVLPHVRLELLRVGARRRLPARVLGGRVEVVRQILGVGVADLPALGQACVAGLWSVSVNLSGPRPMLGAHHCVCGWNVNKRMFWRRVTGEMIMSTQPCVCVKSRLSLGDSRDWMTAMQAPRR